MLFKTLFGIDYILTEDLTPTPTPRTKLYYQNKEKEKSEHFMTYEVKHISYTRQYY